MLTLVIRSVASIVLQSMTDGIAKMTMNDVAIWAQTNSGMRLSDIPGARSLNAVVMISTAPISVLISTIVTICDQTSTRLPGL